MSPREGTAGGTGFLFGNIDRRGRLDEDYMDDDAKDTIDNVGSKVVEKDRDLREITQALPQHKRGPPGQDSDDDDYDDDQPADTADDPPDGTPRVDYYDEDDLLEDELDEKQRSDMAALALRKAQPAKTPAKDDEDDENYDEDEPSAPAPPVKPLPRPALPVKPLPPLPSVPAPAPAPTARPASPLDPALAEQRRLMEEARLAAASASIPGALAAEPEEEIEEDPLHFSKAFTKPTPALRFSPRRRRFGLVVSGAETNPPVERDDVEILDQEHPPDEVDPVGVVLALDADDAAKRWPGGQTKAGPRFPLGKEEAAIVDDEEYASAAAPLDTVCENGDDTSGKHGHIEAEADLPLVQQVSWEDEIRWREDNDSEDEEDAWYSPDAETGEGKGDISKIAGVSKQTSFVDEDQEDDDDEFEDPVLLNVEKAVPEKDKDSDDDEDMEWEDGHESASKADATSREPEAQIKEGAVPSGKTTSFIAVVPPVQGLANGATKQQSSRKEEAQKPSVMRSEREKGDVSADERAKAVVPKSAAMPKMLTGLDSERDVLAPNRELEKGLWLEDVIWDSHSEDEADFQPQAYRADDMSHLRGRFSRLILDPNDPNMIFEHLSDDSTERNALTPRTADEPDAEVTKAKLSELIYSSGTQVHQLLESDRFNISNDIYYASGASNVLKVDRRSILRGLQNAPPAVKCLTTKTVSTDAELLSFRRPVLTADRLPKGMLITPFRRKRPKGGHAQIAGQIPKKKTELFCSEKDAYRVSLYEYALERQPCILPVPGMASRLVTYARKESTAAAAQALKNAAGTPEADTVFMAPDEPPPLHAGDLEANGKPLSVVESHVYAAPCVRQNAKTTDFLLVRNGGKMYVREIDSVVSLGVTEPKVDVMAPNSERYKRYGRERALLWALREFSKKRKEIARQQKSEKRGTRDDDFSAPPEKPFIEKEAILREFKGCRTRPEAWLFKVIKEFSRYQNGKFTIEEEPAKSLAVREAEVLRTVTPVETAAFESMEAGWESLSDTGIQIFTHPSKGNIISAAERSGLEAGPAVAAFIKSRLLKSPWFKSQNIISAQKQQRKELLQVLSLARIVNDLKEGGAVMESRLMSLTAAEMNSVLTNQYRLDSKKIPMDIEERRALVREMAQRKGRGPSQDLSDYAALVRNVLKTHRAAGLAKSAANVPQGMSTTTRIFLGLPLDQQRRALEDGDVSELPTEDQDFAGDLDAAAALAATGEDAFGKRPAPKEKDGKGGLSKRYAKKPPKPPKKAPPPRAITPQAVAEADEQAELKKLLSSAAGAKPPGDGKSQISEPRKVPKKKVTKLKVKRKVTGRDGALTYVEEFITDPVEIERMLQKRKSMKKKAGDRPAISSGKAKVAIDLKMLQQGSKAGPKKKISMGPEKKKSVKKGPGKPGESSDLDNVRIRDEKGMIGKIKISTKQLRKDKEEAALKRKRSQYGDDVEYRAKKTAKTSRRKRNGTVQLNNILEKVEKTIRETEGYIVSHKPVLKIGRLKEGESPPPGAIANNLAAPKNTGLDFTAPVDTKLVPTYKQIIKKPMYLNLIKHKCKRMVYQSAAEFIADMELLVKNARDFNKTEDVAWVVQHAELLLEVAREQISRRADEIKSAEEMVKVEKAEAKASGAGPSSSKTKGKKNLDRGKQQGGKKSNKKRKGPSGEVVVLDGPENDGDALRAEVPVIDLSEEQSRTQHLDFDSVPISSPLPDNLVLDLG